MEWQPNISSRRGESIARPGQKVVDSIPSVDYALSQEFQSGAQPSAILLANFEGGIVTFEFTTADSGSRVWTLRDVRGNLGIILLVRVRSGLI